MHISNSIRFFLQSVIVGLAIALVMLLIWPDLAYLNRKPEQGVRADNSLQSYNPAVTRAAPAVVNVYASKTFQEQLSPLFQDPLFQRFFGQTPPPSNKRRDSNLGSGVIMSHDGYILTNSHVIQDKDEIHVTLNDGRLAKADIIGVDSDTDLAVLRINLDNLPVIDIGNSNDLFVGDVVLAIGNPYDFGQTVTQGIVSAKGRKRMGITTFEDFIQTDADINPGNSGGALINARGQLVGINTAIISNTGGSQGIGLATPVNLAMEVMRQLIDNGRVVRGWLGIEAQILPADTVREAGLKNGGILVAGVLQGGPADQAGMVPGDIILQVASRPVSNPQTAIEMISSIRPGTVVNIKIMRGWVQMDLEATVAVRPVFRK